MHLMMSYLLSLPRASWKARAVAVLVMAFCVLPFAQQWPNRHEDLALVRWYAWSVLVCNAWMFSLAFIVGVLGRMPKSLARRPGRLGKTLPQIYQEIAQEKADTSRRSKSL
jgi:hypothetical protein